jgi:hypothetical protein
MTEGEMFLAAKEHTINSKRRTCAHVILTHDINTKTKSIMQMFRYGVDVSPAACVEIIEALADDILSDVEVLMQDLENIKQWALKQKAKLNE